MKPHLFVAGLLLSALAACSSSEPTLPGDRTLVGPGPLAGTPGFSLEQPLRIRVLEDGDPVSGATVTWSTDDQNAWLSTTVSDSDAEGYATVQYAPGHASGTQTVRATVGLDYLDIDIDVGTLEVVTLAAGNTRACGLDLQGTLWCWKINNGSTSTPPAMASEFLPVRAQPGINFVELAGTGPDSYDQQFCGLTGDNRLLCWMSSDFNADGSVEVEEWAMPAPLASLTVSARDGLEGDATVCGLDADGQAWCRGSNDDGQLGDGTTTDRTTFAPVSGSQRFISLSSTPGTVCGLDSGNLAWCWGLHASYQAASQPLLVPTRVGGSYQYSDVAPSLDGACGIRLVHQSLHCWGSEWFGDLDVYDAVVDVESTWGLTSLLSGNYRLLFATTTDGALVLAGDAFHDMGYNSIFKELTPHLEMTSGVASPLSGTVLYWCTRHTSGSTLCGYGLRRVAGVPRP